MALVPLKPTHSITENINIGEVHISEEGSHWVFIPDANGNLKYSEIVENTSKGNVSHSHMSQVTNDEVFPISDSYNINCLPVTIISPTWKPSDPDNIKPISIWTGRKGKTQMIIDKQV